jgi:hypothetical protein
MIDWDDELGQLLHAARMNDALARLRAVTEGKEVREMLLPLMIVLIEGCIVDAPLFGGNPQAVLNHVMPAANAWVAQDFAKRNATSSLMVQTRPKQR